MQFFGTVIFNKELTPGYWHMRLAAPAFFAQAEPGATGLELLLSVACKWAQEQDVPLARALAVVRAISVPSG